MRIAAHGLLGGLFVVFVMLPVCWLLEERETSLADES